MGLLVIYKYIYLYLYIWVMSVEKYFALYINWAVCFFVTEVFEFVFLKKYILYICPVLDICIIIAFQTVAKLFIFLSESFDKQQLLILMKSNLSTFFFYSWWFCLLRNLWLSQGLWDIFLHFVMEAYSFSFYIQVDDQPQNTSSFFSVVLSLGWFLFCGF